MGEVAAGAVDTVDVLHTLRQEGQGGAGGTPLPQPPLGHEVVGVVEVLGAPGRPLAVQDDRRLWKKE